MASSDNSSSGGIGLSGVLLVVFVVLKLVHVIDWPWVWVLSPLWIPLAIVLFFLALAALIAAAVGK